MTDLQHQLEALLFSSGKKMAEEELARLSRASAQDVHAALLALRQKYDDRESSLMIINEGSAWKITVKERHLSLVKKIVTHTELSKTMIETLAIIAWKAPCLQSEIIRLRTNKAYDHIKQLEQDGYVTRKKEGRTQRITLAPKFYEYFDIPHEKIQQVFGKFKNLEGEIQKREEQGHDVKEKIKMLEEEHRRQREAWEKGVQIDDTAMEVVAQDIPSRDGSAELQPYEEKLGELSIVDVEPEKTPPAQEQEQPKEAPIPRDIEQRIDKRVEEIVGSPLPVEDAPLNENLDDSNSEEEIAEDASPIADPRAAEDADLPPEDKEKIVKRIDKRVHDITNPDSDA